MKTKSDTIVLRLQRIVSRSAVSDTDVPVWAQHDDHQLLREAIVKLLIDESNAIRWYSIEFVLPYIVNLADRIRAAIRGDINAIGSAEPPDTPDQTGDIPAYAKRNTHFSGRLFREHQYLFAGMHAMADSSTGSSGGLPPIFVQAMNGQLAQLFAGGTVESEAICVDGLEDLSGVDAYGTEGFNAAAVGPASYSGTAVTQSTSRSAHGPQSMIDTVGSNWDALPSSSLHPGPAAVASSGQQSISAADMTVMTSILTGGVSPLTSMAASGSSFTTIPHINMPPSYQPSLPTAYPPHMMQPALAGGLEAQPFLPGSASYDTHFALPHDNTDADGLNDILDFDNFWQDGPPASGLPMGGSSQSMMSGAATYNTVATVPLADTDHSLPASPLSAGGGSDVRKRQRTQAPHGHSDMMDELGMMHGDSNGVEPPNAKRQAAMLR